MRHLDADMLLMIAEGKIPPRVLLQMMYEHLKELCPECRANLEALRLDGGVTSLVGALPVDRGPLADEFPVSAASTPSESFADPETGDDSPYAKAFEQAALKAGLVASRLVDEREEAQVEFEELMSLPPESRAARVHGAGQRFRSRSLVELLLKATGEQTRKDPIGALGLVDVSFAVLDRIRDSTGQGWAEELKVRVLARKANALRVSGDLASADATFREVHAFLRDNVLELADVHPEVASAEASLRSNQGRVQEAVECSDLAVRGAMVAGDKPLLARLLVARAENLRVAERLEDAGRDLEAALKLIRPEDDSHLYACAVCAQALLLCETEKAAEAAQVYERHHVLLEEHDEAWVRINATFLRGAIAQARGDLASAEDCFIESRDLFVQHNQLFSASSIALDLAEIYLAQGRTQDLKEVASWLGVLFDSTPQHQRAAVALMLFQQATMAEQVTHEAIHGLRRTLERARMERSTSQPS